MVALYLAGNEYGHEAYELMEEERKMGYRKQGQIPRKLAIGTRQPIFSFS